MFCDTINPSTRLRVIERARDCCEYCLCQRQFSPAPFSIEHIFPRSLGGNSQIENLALACQGCNNHKFAHATGTDPISTEEVRLYNPRADIWSEHFIWSEDFAEIIKLSARGRATISRLCLNRAPVVALRRILADAGLHPPAYPYGRLNL